jgi:hypothetical protein
MPTDKKILSKGLKYLGWALPMFFIGPVVIHSSLKNQGNPFYIPVLILGCIICLLAIVFSFIGIRTVMKSMFNNPYKK